MFRNSFIYIYIYLELVYLTNKSYTECFKIVKMKDYSTMLYFLDVDIVYKQFSMCDKYINSYWFLAIQWWTAKQWQT